MKEIGSEFWTEDITGTDNGLNFLNIGKDYKLLMSGRTAIDYVLNDFDDKTKIVYMPDYCCESMVQPFLDNKYKIIYYYTDVINNKYDIDLNINCSVFFAMSYFGYNSSNMDKYIAAFSKKGVVVIEDITHRLLCDNNYCKDSTYLIASLRKWFPLICGGIAVKINNQFDNNFCNYIIDEKFVNIKQNAMNLKKDYINSKSNNKTEFLKLFNTSNKLIEDYRNKKIDNTSLEILKHLDIDRIKKIRIENCLKIESIIKSRNINLLYNYQKGDCPLYVPVLLNNRDKIRNKLIENNIYLPIHWPNFKAFDNDIYKYELSLICDQRYNEKICEKYINKFIEIIDKVDRL